MEVQKLECYLIIYGSPIALHNLSLLTEWRHEWVLGLVAPGGRVDARVGVLHPQVVLLRPSVIVDLEKGWKIHLGEMCWVSRLLELL